MPKRIIDGVTYNTDTATLVARSKEADWRGTPVAVHSLYLTRGGAFFAVKESEWDRDGGPDQNGDWSRRAFEPLTREEAQTWILEGDVEVYTEVFDLPPEVEAPTGKPEATIYVRVPAALRDRLAGTAEEAGQSVNAYALRCFERCLGDNYLQRELVRAWYEVSSIETVPDGYSREQMIEMASSARNSIESAWDLLGYTDNDLYSTHGSMMSARELPDRPPYVEDGPKEAAKPRKRRGNVIKLVNDESP